MVKKEQENYLFGIISKQENTKVVPTEFLPLVPKSEFQLFTVLQGGCASIRCHVSETFWMRKWLLGPNFYLFGLLLSGK